MEYIVQGEPKDTFKPHRSLYDPSTLRYVYEPSEVSAKFYPPGGWFAMFLRVLYLHGLRVVVSPAQGSGYTRVRLDPTGRKAKKSGERMMLEEFGVATRDLGS